MKRALIVTVIVGFAVFCTNSAFAQSISISTEVQTAQSGSVPVKMELATGHEAALALLKAKSAEFGSAAAHIMVSDMSAEAVAAGLNEAIPAELNELTEHSTLGFFEIDEPTKPISKKERIEGVAFAIMQTGIASTAFLYVSSLPLEPAIASSVLAGFLNFYFNWDIERWDKLQRWGRNKMKTGVALLGQTNWQNTNWFNKTSKSITGYVGRIGFAAMFTGIALWENFASEFCSIGTAERVMMSSLIGALMSQSFDTTFGDWLEKGHKVFSPSQVKLMIRLRSLIATGIMPFVYLSYHSAYVAAGAMALAGLTVALYDQYDDIEEKFSLKFENIKKSVKNFWKNSFSNKGRRTNPVDVSGLAAENCASFLTEESI